MKWKSKTPILLLLTSVLFIHNTLVSRYIEVEYKLLYISVFVIFTGFSLYRLRKVVLSVDEIGIHFHLDKKVITWSSISSYKRSFFRGINVISEGKEIKIPTDVFGSRDEISEFENLLIKNGIKKV